MIFLLGCTELQMPVGENIEDDLSAEVVNSVGYRDNISDF